MKARVLTADQELLAAKELAWSVLLKQQTWPDLPANTHGLLVEQVDGRTILCDHYDADATWFGLFDGTEMVACGRHCRRLYGKFELEHHTALPSFLARDPDCVEATRFVVKRDYMHSDALLVLFTFAIAHGVEHGCGYYFTSGPYPRPGKLFVDALGMQIHGRPFRYPSWSEQRVYLYYLTGGA